MKYRVITITNNLMDYPEYAVDTAEFPGLVESIEDECQVYVIDENGSYCDAEDFFSMNDIKEFEVK